LTANYSQSLRKKIRQAEKQGYRIIESENYSYLLEMIIGSYRRHNLKPLIKEKYLSVLLDMVKNLKQITVFDCVKGSQVFASRMILTDGDSIYDLLAGSNDPEGLASPFLVHQILYGMAGKFSSFDFLGADHPQVEQFKRGFGGELIQGFRITSRPKIPLNLLIPAYQYYLKKERLL
jgi:hypothetical protein